MGRRDRALIVVALVVMAALAGLVIQTVADARRRGVDALEQAKTEQVGQLARSMDTRLSQLYSLLAGITSVPYELEVGSEFDQAALDALAAQNPNARTGELLLDRSARITAGVLLQSDDVIGSTFDRPGIENVLSSGQPGWLTVGPGLTTSSATIALALPLFDATTGDVRGAMVFESDVGAESGFNEEVASLATPDGGRYLFLDESDSVVASSDLSLLGRPFDDTDVATATAGFQRVDGRVVVVGQVPTSGWRAVFVQDAGDFEQGLSQRLQLAMVLIIVAGIVAGGLAIVAIAGRLRAARQEQARLAEINRTREEFLSIVSHELRTPVAGVVGFLQTTLDHWHQLDDDQRRETLLRAAANARRLQSLTRDVLDVTNVERGHLTVALGPVDLGEELSTAVSAMRELDPTRPITLVLPEAPVPARGDGDRLLQVLLNLFENAANGSPAGAAIDVRLEHHDDEAIVAVTDHGPGLAPGERTAVFEKFVRGQATGIRGSGLGLFVCRQIVEAHGGHIWAENGPDGGAQFAFSIPAPQVRAVSVAEAAPVG